MTMRALGPSLLLGAVGLGVGMTPGAATRAQAASCSAGTYGPVGAVFRGTIGRQTLVLTYDAAGLARASLDCNGDGDFTDAADVLDQPVDNRGADIQLGGSDTIVVNAATGWTGIHKKILVLLGPGRNSLTLDFGSSTLVNSSFTMELSGTAGVDTVTLVNPPVLNGSGLSLRADLGPGNDVAAIALPAVQSGSQVSFDLDLGPGSNALTLDQARSTMAVGAVQVNLEGGAGPDALTVLLNGTWSSGSRFLLDADLGAGSDRLDASLSSVVPDAFLMNAAADVRLWVRGSLGNDRLSVLRTGAGILDGRLDVSLQGGAGADPITVDLGGLDMLGGLVRLRADGGPGNDVVAIALDTTSSLGTANHDVAVSGGAGNDVLSFDQSAAASSVFVGPSVLDGSFGTGDQCVVGGADPPRVRSCEL